jgi:hypothetical protein
VRVNKGSMPSPDEIFDSPRAFNPYQPSRNLNSRSF